MQLKRITQSGSSSAEEIKTVEDNKLSFQQSLEDHKIKKQAHEFHTNEVKKVQRKLG